MEHYSFVGVGGMGVHSIRVFSELIKVRRVPLEQMLIIDPLGPLEQWVRKGKQCGMTGLTTSRFVHLGTEPKDLVDFAWSKHSTAFSGPPSFSVFNEHSWEVASSCGLQRIHLRDSAERIDSSPTGLKIRTTQGLECEADRIMLSLGPGKLSRPPWAEELKSTGLIHHVFDQDFDPNHLTSGMRLAIVGGALSAVQLANAICNNCSVTLISRSPIEAAEEDRPGRTKALHSRDYWDMRRAAEENKLTCLERVDIKKVHVRNQTVQIELSEGGSHEFDRVVVATGFLNELPDLLRDTASNLSLPIAANGLPQLTSSLEWGEGSGIHVIGRWAQNRLGDYALNLQTPQKQREPSELCISNLGKGVSYPSDNFLS